MKQPERRNWHPSDTFYVNFEQILQIVLVFPFLTLYKQVPGRLTLLTLFEINNVLVSLLLTLNIFHNLF